MKITRYIPNAVTSMNLLSGVLGVMAVFADRPDAAFYLMIAAAVFDFCDGLAARALNAYSEIGKQLDSLSDLVSFGVLPALMLYRLMCSLGVGTVWCLVPVLMALFAAFRLAKFNIDERQSENFLGLAVPACAMICGSFAYYVSHDAESILTVWAATPWFIPAGSLVLSLLMVSGIPMFSMKWKKGMKADTPVQRMRTVFIGVAAVCCLLVLLLGLNWSMIVLLVFLSYIVINLINLLLTK